MSRMLRKMLVLVRGADPGQPAVQRAALLAGRNTSVALLDLVHEPKLDGYMGNRAIHEALRKRVVAERAEDMQRLVATLHERGLDAAGKAEWGHPLDEAVTAEVRSQKAPACPATPTEQLAYRPHTAGARGQRLERSLSRTV